MLIDASLIGNSSSPHTFEVTEEAVRRFMEATGDPALQSDAPLLYAPPTFPTTFRGFPVPGLELDSSKSQLLNGEHQKNYARALAIARKAQGPVAGLGV